ncbi:inhibitor of growth protein 4-like [Rhopalosiphum maidis]|uniref:inhibitor of growth protein 4-like n=1 Tax=Rhopalosiphum maidis TaxID=43146 RepID=UPI000EFEC60D|nr:inhibitor of growth protein 4-like [Rhopalosiphum maidis]XP_026817603.1 inhibitor of growth protein 4-like [Rhopalosiphum maidis]XP_026817604.1 inhibitor of growth protein 4-like [Rhopalosiphum maidis]XP_026817605.1 inhibitor of growth protein 4-like [Rhopalosiphum maidis]XP_026817606.1 inhibitor of growth protein 4-like [Rhopalosiphum maidis]
MVSPSDMDKFLANLGNLPSQIQQNLRLLQNIDLKSQDLIRNITKETDDYLKNQKYLTDKKKKRFNRIQRQFVKAKEYGDDKVQLSLQTYTVVDDVIKKMDAYLMWYEANNQVKAINVAKTIEEGSQKKKLDKTENNDIKKKQLNKGGKKTSAASKKALLDVKIPKKFPRSGVVGVRPAAVIDMPVDPNEPKYCLCNQVSFGEMIGCDNPDCTIEWFHFVCVKLTTKPKGKWFCPKCKQPEEKQ